MGVAVEICVRGIASAMAAGEGGADRIELCEDPAVGGVTPGAGTIAVACRRLEIPVHVLIRPRGGDFVYSAAEFEVMRRDVEVAKGLGASGVVLGLLGRGGAVDRRRTARLVEAARPLSVTFHKAFDAARDPFEALEDLVGHGVDRVLTSGRAATAAAGLGLLADLVRRASGRIAVMAGGSVALADVPALIGAGLREIHVGSAACSGGRTDAAAVRRLVEAARRGGP
jgi:copper homeostasis protein